jgi:cellulose synthase/poly-beta-1,6-N-acetylglucosamine synthase-like glycosyltransferase
LENFTTNVPDFRQLDRAASALGRRAVQLRARDWCDAVQLRTAPTHQNLQPAFPSCMTTFPVYLLIFVVFLNRYLGGLWLRMVRGSKFDEKVQDYEPNVTAVIPLYNEGEGVRRTIRSLLEQDYPSSKLDVIVVDDCSTDDSHFWAAQVRNDVPSRVRLLCNPSNIGKRRSLNRAVHGTTSEIIVSVDSDVTVDRLAVRRLVARFTRPEIAAVGGRVNVVNAGDNWLTRMQTCWSAATSWASRSSTAKTAS